MIWFIVKIFSNTKSIIIPPSVITPKKDISNKELKYYSVSRIDPLKNIEYIFNNLPINSRNFTQYGKIISSDSYYIYLSVVTVHNTVNKIN